MTRAQRALIALFVVTLPLVTPRIRGADEIEYFSYLRSLVFDRDLDFTNEYAHFVERDPQGLAGFKATFLERREPLTGRPINFAPLGSALLWSPFYLVAHGVVLLARGLGAELAADGLSTPYVAAACLGSAVYGFLGLLLAHDALLRFGGVREPAGFLAVLCLWLGTPLLYYMTLAPGFSHAPAAFAVALLLWLSVFWREEVRSGPWAVLGAVGGLCALVREQDALFLVVPAGFLAFDTVRRRAWTQGIRRAVLLGTGALLAFLPQLLAYHAINGSFSPSRLVARKMSYGSPHAWQVLLDPAHGLFWWTPVLLLAAVGLFASALRRREPVSLLLLAAFLLQVWINGSVESWHMAGAFGARRFVDATPVLAWGLAVAVAAALRFVPVAAVVAGVLLAVWWNVSLMVQFGLRLMDRQRLDWPQVAIRQVTEVPPRLSRAAWLFFTDRERLVRESR